jgi:hypothetical protein
VYWCYFRHEHGSDPALVAPGHKPLYGYAATAAGENEAHPGFKSYAFDDGAGRRWLLSHHFGTASVARACVRHHEVSILTAALNGEILADIRLMGDFGRSITNTNQQPYTPPACPNQAAQAIQDGSDGMRQLPIASQPVGYEPWMVDGSSNVIGFRSSSLTFNTKNPIMLCLDLLCASGRQTADTGNIRFFSYHSGFGIVAGANTGTFYTDPRGLTLRSQGQAGAVRQFVKPGLSAIAPHSGGSCHATDNWRVLYRCSATPLPDGPANLEGALQSPN